MYKTFDQPANGHTFNQPGALTTSGVIPSHSIPKLKEPSKHFCFVHRGGNMGGLSTVNSLRTRNAH